MTSKNMYNFVIILLQKEFETMKKYKILVVEDEKNVLNLLNNILLASNYEVFLASDGAEALEIISEILPDAIISDIMMPNINGIELLKELKKDASTALIPFLFLTAKADIQDRVDGLSIGADDYICKPFRNEELLARLKTRLKRKEILLQSTDIGTIHGDLSIFSIVDLLQIMKLEKKTGELVLAIDAIEEDKAFIKLNDGEVVDVEFRNKNGIEAFKQMLLIEQGTFSFKISKKKFNEKIKIGTQELVYSQIKILDEQRYISSVIGSLDQILEITDQQTEISLSDDAIRIISLIDGKHSVLDILNLSSLNEIETSKILTLLFKIGVLRVKTRVITTEKEKEKKSIISQLSGEGKELLEELIENNIGIPSIIITGPNDKLINKFVKVLAGDLSITDDVNLFQSSKHFNIKKLILDKSELNIYGIKGLQQFFFLHKLIDKDILGVFILCERVQHTEDDELSSFCKSLYKELDLPYMTVVFNREDYHQTVKSHCRNIIFIDPDSTKDLESVFMNWLYITTEKFRVKRVADDK